MTHEEMVHLYFHIPKQYQSEARWFSVMSAEEFEWRTTPWWKRLFKRKPTFAPDSHYGDPAPKSVVPFFDQTGYAIKPILEVRPEFDHVNHDYSEADEAV